MRSSPTSFLNLVAFVSDMKDEQARRFFISSCKLTNHIDASSHIFAVLLNFCDIVCSLFAEIFLVQCKHNSHICMYVSNFHALCMRLVWFAGRACMCVRICVQSMECMHVCVRASMCIVYIHVKCTNLCVCACVRECVYFANL
jgi:hypothetical protein